METMAHFFSIKASRFGWMKFNFQFRIYHFFLFLILILAAFLRVYRIDEYMTFLGDEGRDVLVVREIIQGVEKVFQGDFSSAQEKLTLLGPTASVGGFFLGPIYYYFMAPFLWLFNFNPVGPAVMVAIFGVATVWLVYKVGSDFFNPFVGILAAFLYAISPVIIAYSRSSWNPNLMPFFSLLALYTVYLAVKKHSLLLFFVCGFLLGIAMQLHYLTVFLGSIVAVYVLISTYTKFSFFSKITQMICILLGFLVGLAPFFAFEVRHGFPNMQSIIRFIFFSGETGSNENFLVVIDNVFFRLFGRLIGAFPSPEQVSFQESVATMDLFFTKFTIAVGAWYLFILLLAFLSISLFLYQWYRALRSGKRNLAMMLIFIWFVMGIGLFGFYKKSIYDYYFGFLFPLPFFLIGNFLYALWKRNLWYKAVGIIIFILLLILNIQGIPFRYTANRQLVQVKQIAEFVLEKTEGKPFNFALITGGNSDHGYRYFFALADKDPIKIENTQMDPKRTTVTNQLLIICETVPCYPLGHPLWEIAGFGRAEIVGEWSASVVKVYKMKHYKQD